MTPQELKKSILKLAFKGGVSFQSTEEDSKALLNEILRNGFKSNKYIKFTDDVIPYDIPDNWSWCMFYNIVSLENGLRSRGKKLPYLEAKYLRGLSEPKIYSEGEVVFPGQKVILVDGENSGEIFEIKEKGYLGSTFKVLNIFNCIDEEYALYFMRLYQDEYRNNKKGAAIPHLNKNVFFEKAFPLPPIEEQKRIICKIKEIEPFLEKYEKAWTKLESFNKRFPLDMEKSILQSAMKGKIAEHLVSDSDVDELLKRIYAERKDMVKRHIAKKPKDYGSITDDEIPFDIPETWRWIRLADAVYNHGQETPTSVFSYIDIGSIDNKNQKLNETENLIEAKDAPSRARKIVEQGDILYSTVRPYLHNMCIIDKDFSCKPIASTGFAVLSCHTGIYNKYLFYYLLSPLFDDYANKTENSRGVAYPAINDDKLYKAIIPLPPYEEQMRIVDKIDELLPLCRKLIRQEVYYG